VALYLGIDLGTQSLKALLLDPERGIAGVAAAPLELRPDLPSGHSEQDPADWLDALRLASAQVLRESGAEPGAIEGIGVSGQQHGLVALDASHRVIRPAKLWNDVSCAPQCEAIKRELGAQRLFALTGNHLPPGFTGGKVRWLAEHEPQHHARLALVLLPHDWLNLYLTGEACCEAGDASGTGFFDVTARAFVPEVMAAISPRLAACMPPLRAPGTGAGLLRAGAARELGLRAGCLVSAGSGDNMMAALGAGAVRSGIVVLSLGTSGTVFAYADRPVVDPQGEIAAFCDSTGGWLPLGCTMNATVATELARKALALSLAEFEATAAQAPPGARGALCLPFFTGERSPDLPAASGAMLGLTPASFTPACLARAAIEGATFAGARLLDRLVALGAKLEELRLTGGGSHSALWQQIVADACGRPVAIGVAPDAAALGAAIHACWTHRRQAEPGYTAADCVRDLGLDAGLTVREPEPGAVEVYRERRIAYQRAVDALTPVFPGLR
jgi:D-xylulose kinase